MQCHVWYNSKYNKGIDFTCIYAIWENYVYITQNLKYANAPRTQSSRNTRITCISIIDEIILNEACHTYICLSAKIRMHLYVCFVLYWIFSDYFSLFIVNVMCPPIRCVTVFFLVCCFWPCVCCVRGPCGFAFLNGQLIVAQIMSASYALIMMAVIVGTTLQLGEDGIGSPSAIFLIALSGSFFIAACMHPQEFKCIIPGLLYLLSIPSMYLLLIIYSLINLNNVSWGTREIATKKTKKVCNPSMAGIDGDGNGEYSGGDGGGGGGGVCLGWSRIILLDIAWITLIYKEHKPII